MSAPSRDRATAGGWALAALVMTLLAGGCGSNPAGPELPPGAIAETEPNDPSPQMLGTLVDGTDVVVGGTASGRNDVDLFSVTLATPGSLYMSLSWTTAGRDLEVGVTDANGIVIHNQDTPSANPEQCTVTGRAAGTYRIRVGSRSGAATNYLLTVGRR